MTDSTDRDPPGRESRIEELVDEFVRARRAGDLVSADEIVAANPDLEPDLSQRLSFAECLVKAVLKADSEATAQFVVGRNSRLRCPHCGHIIHVVEDSAEVTCGSCGSSLDHAEEAGRSYSPASARIAHFDLIEQVGRGGFGVVYRAMDTRLERPVALKIPRRGYFGTREEETRFLREARSAANLRHPNIVQVYEVGTERDSHYIAAQFIEGRNASDIVDGQQLPFRKTAGWLEKIAVALHYAHENGVIHRDVKPANILIDLDDEPYLTDFGLARQGEPAITVTRDGEVLGTPAYMSPEQAAAEHSRLDRRSDVYSLGVTLFRMLSGDLPFRGSRRMLLNKVMHDDPPTVRSLNETVPKDLETIALRAMEKAPEKRYSTALEFAQELQRWLAGDPILARPISGAERAWRWCKKRPLISSLLATIALLLCSISIGAIIWGVRENRLKEIAEASDIESRERLSSAFASSAAERLEDNDSLGSLPYAVEALAVQESLESPRGELTRIQLGATFATSPRLLQVDDLGRSVAEIIRHPGGDGFLVTAGSTIRLYDRQWQRREVMIEASHDVHFAMFNSPGDRILGFNVDDGGVTLWDAETGERIDGPGQPGFTDGVFSPDGSLLATAGGEGNAEVRVWSTADGTLQTTLLQAGATAWQVRFSSDGARLAVLSHELVDETAEQYALSLWDLATRKEVKVPIPRGEFHRITFLTDGRLLTISNSGLYRAYDADGEVDADFELQAEPASQADSTRQGQAFVSVLGAARLASLGNGAVRIRDLANPQNTVGPIEHDGFIDQYGFTVSPDLSLFATAGEHQRVNIHRTATGERVGPAIGHGTTVRAAEFLTDTILATGTTAGAVKIWDLSGITRGSSIFKHDHRVVDAVFSSDSQRVSTTSNDGRATSKTGPVAVWSRESEERLSLFDHGAPAMATAFSPDGRTVVSSDFSGGLIARDAHGLDDTPETRKDSAWINEIRFPPKTSDVFATSNSKGNIRVWHQGSPQPVHSFAHAEFVRSLDFDPSGRFLASCSKDQTARVWNVESGEPACEALPHEGDLAWCRFSPDGRLLGTSGYDGRVTLWDWRAGKPVTTFASSGRQHMFDFSPDGSRLCSMNSFGVAQIWRADSHEQPRWSFPHPGINSVDWHPSLPLVVAAGDRSGDTRRAFARVWDADSGLPLSPELPVGGSAHAVFSPDGTAILTRSDDTTARVWSILPTDHSIETLRSLAIVFSGMAMRERRLVAVPVKDQVETFNTLRDRMPGVFTSSQKERQRFRLLRDLRNEARR